MGKGATEPAARIVGREPELAELRRFLEPDSPDRALVLAGGPGMGKTTLWEEGLDRAREHGLRVFSARPSGAEVELAFAGLSDLLDEVDIKAIAGVPAPQLRALEVAVLRAEPAGVPTEAHAISLGFLNALRALAADQRLLVAIDDVQWLDPGSADALVFAARRLEGDPVGFMLTKRSHSSSVLLRALGSTAVRRLEVEPMSLGATRRILFERLGLSLPRRVMRQIFESSLGNPLLALELGRTLAERGALEIGEEIPVSDLAEELLGTRVEGLRAPVRRLLLAVALSPDPRTFQLSTITDPGAIDDAVDTGILQVEGDRVRAAQPLLAAAARKRSRGAERRERSRTARRSLAARASSRSRAPPLPPRRARN